jgi:hypothetical protein
MSLEVRSTMRFRTAVSIATFFMLCFAISLWSAPLPAEVGPLCNPSETSSLSGTIAKVNSSQLMLALDGDPNSKNLEFVIESNTMMDGKLAVGSRISVEYRAEGQQFVATHVVVLPASGIQL